MNIKDIYNSHKSQIIKGIQVAVLIFVSSFVAGCETIDPVTGEKIVKITAHAVDSSGDNIVIYPVTYTYFGYHGGKPEYTLEDGTEINDYSVKIIKSADPEYVCKLVLETVEDTKVIYHGDSDLCQSFQK